MVRVLGALGIVLLLGLGFAWLWTVRGDDLPGLDASVLGTNGLVPVLQGAGVAVQVAGDGRRMRAEDIDLRILPLYDMDLEDDRPETLGDTTQRTMPLWRLTYKLYDGTPLIVLPKWRWVAAETAIAAPETAIPLADYPRLMTQLNLEGLRLLRGGAEFHSWIFLPQVFDPATIPPGCRPAWEDVSGIGVLACDEVGGRVPFHILSDPDLFNNHGLVHGDVASRAAGLVRLLQTAPKRPVYLDRLAEDLTTRVEGEERDYTRTSEDYLRFFKSPLGEIWAMLAILLALFLWRGGRRFGPLLPEDEAGVERSRREAVATRARLIRLTGQDGAMVADYVKTDLQRMAEAALGQGGGEVARLFPLLARRNAEKAAAFQALAQDLMRGLPQPAPALRRQLDTYHQLQRTLTHGTDA